MPHIPAMWYFDTFTYPQWFSIIKLLVIPHFLSQYLWSIALQTAVGCCNSWTNLRCSGCSPLGEKMLWNRYIEIHLNCSIVLKCVQNYYKVLKVHLVLVFKNAEKMETLSAILALCVGKPRIIGGSPHKVWSCGVLIFFLLAHTLYC